MTAEGRASCAVVARPACTSRENEHANYRLRLFHTRRRTARYRLLVPTERFEYAQWSKARVNNRLPRLGRRPPPLGPARLGPARRSWSTRYSSPPFGDAPGREVEQRSRQAIDLVDDHNPLCQRHVTAIPVFTCADLGVHMVPILAFTCVRSRRSRGPEIRSNSSLSRAAPLKRAFLEAHPEASQLSALVRERLR